MLRNKSPGANAGGHKALGRETVICDRDRCASHTQTPGEFASGRQAFAKPNAAFEDGPAELPVNLSAEIFAADKIDVNFHGSQYIQPHF
jgi:hypothetical protein